MRRISELTPRRVHLVGIGLVVAALVGGTIGMAASPAAQFSSGSLRLSSASSDTSVSVDSDTIKRVLRTSISVPSGKVADVQATFSTAMLPNIGSSSYCFGYFTLDSQTNIDPQFKPGQVQLLGGAVADLPNAVGVAMTGFRKNIGPGTHYINMYINPSFAGCILMERALNVVVNVH